MRGFAKWGSIVILSALALLAVWSGLTGPGRNAGNRDMGQRVRFVQPLPDAGSGSDTGSQAPNTRSRPMGTLQDTRRVAESVAGVKKAWPVQTGNDFLIGLELDMRQGGNAGAIENTVAQRVRSQVPGVDNVRVTVQPSQVTRIRTVSQSVALGRPTADYARDIADLWKSVPATQPGRLQR